MDKRLELLADWTRSVLDDPGLSLAPASEDASFRRYFRAVSRGATYIVMDAPPDREDTGPFLRAAERLASLGLNVPQILARDSRRGLVLMSDLGTTTYLARLSDDSADELYGDALAALVVLQGGTAQDPDFFPRYDSTLLWREMELFREWYVPRRLGTTLTAAEDKLVSRTFDMLARSAGAQPQAWVHRDYHSRNLMVTDIDNPGILDFQDAVVGPVTYDLVSLLKDCYVEWPQERVVRWATDYFHLAGRAGLDTGGDADQFLRWFHLMGAQRHIKVLGIFSRLYYRDGKAHYLDDLPLVQRYLLAVCGEMEELSEFGELLMSLQRRAA